MPGAGYATTRVQYANDLFFDEARAFVERSRDRPFFLFLSLTVPHANNERARALGDGQEVPDYGDVRHEGLVRPAEGPGRDDLAHGRAQVGELLARLKQLGIDERTLVVFSSDNGPHKEGGPHYDPDFFDANGPFSGIKRSLTDGGIRVPFIVRWPGTDQGRKGVSARRLLRRRHGDVRRAVWRQTASAGLDSVSLVPTLLGRGTGDARASPSTGSSTRAGSARPCCWTAAGRASA